MTARPGQVKALLGVDLPRPRERTSPEFNELYRMMDDLIRVEVGEVVGSAGFGFRGFGRGCMNRKMVTRAISIGGLIILWFVVTNYKLVNPLFLPPPKEVWEGAVDLFQAGELQEHIAVSLWRMFKGFVVGSFTGVIIGILMGQFRFFHAAVGPLVGNHPARSRPGPGFRWPLSGSVSKTPPKYSSYPWECSSPLSPIPSWGSARWTPFWCAPRAAWGPTAGTFSSAWSFPEPSLTSSPVFGLGVQVSFALLVAAELVGSTSGLGFLIQDARNYFRGDLVILGMVVIGTLGFSITRLVEIAERWFLRWHPKSREGAFY